MTKLFVSGILNNSKGGFCMRYRNPSKNEITEGVIWKQLLLFFFPILLGTFFQQLYNTVDAIVVGQFVGTEALAAVGGTTGTLINLLVGFFVGLASGATVIISQYYGARKLQETSDAVHTSIAMAIVGGLVLMVIGFFGAPIALRWMGTPENIMNYSLTYIRVYFIGMVANLIYNVGAGILRAVGDSKRPMYFLILCCLVNIVLDLFFVIVLKWAVFGVAFATFLSQVFSCLLILNSLTKTDQCYQLYFNKIKFNYEILKEIVMIGIPAGLQSAMYSVSNIVIQSSINSFGTLTIAAYTAYTKIDGLFWMIMSAFGVSITTFVGQNFGAGKVDRVKKSVWICEIMALGVAIGLSGLLLLGGQFVYQLFTSDHQVITEGMQILRFLVPFYITYVSVEVLSGATRGTGDSLIPTIMTCLGICVLRVAWIFIAVPISHQLKTVLFSYPMTWSITSILFILYYLQGGWLKRRLKAAKQKAELQQSKLEAQS